MATTLLLRRGGLFAGLFAVMIGVALTVSGAGDRLDRLIDPLRIAAWTVPASKQVVVVEMDAASVAAVRNWPWPREHYATVVDRLRRAGAASITFDVDLSSASTPAGDAAFARALERAEGLVALPTFAQQARSGDIRSIDSLPLPAFRPHVALASVSMQPDSDGIVRRAPFGTVTAAQPRPSLSSYIAKRSGSADTFFPIDFSIDHRTLPHLSFVAVERGRFDPDEVRDRDIVIGATAVEMGDRYATPHWGVIPGVIVQALAAETLLPSVPVQGSGLAMLALATLLIAPVLMARSERVAIAAALLAPAILFAIAVGLQIGMHRVEPLAPALIAAAIAGVGRMALQLARRFDEQRRVDEETGLPTRRAMMEGRATLPGQAVLVAAIGNFGDLTTLLGREAGIDMVQRIAERLRLTGSPVVYRIADALLAIEMAGATDELDDQAAGLRAVLTQPVEIQGRKTDAAVHVGISDEGHTIGDRLSRAIGAAEAAKASGAFLSRAGADDDDLERRLVLMGELDAAIASGQIEVHYQPKLSLGCNRITSVEALVRWRHPTRGMVRPDLFIPLAEQSDRIGPLTLFVMQRVIDDLGEWQSIGLEITAAVNLSALLVAEPGFSAAFERMLEASRVPPQRLILEVTESATLADPERAAGTLQRFRDKGVAVSMDDYGTGQSTLTYLRQLPLSELKIDRSFVQHAHVNRSDALMVRSTVDLAHNLGLKVVAEGVEDQPCLDFLREIRCDFAQGYFISRPIPAVDLVKLLQTARLAA